MIIYLVMACGIWAGIAVLAPGYDLTGHGGFVETALVWASAWLIPYAILHAAMFEGLYPDDRLERGEKATERRLGAVEADNEALKADNEALKARVSDGAEHIRKLEADVELLKAALHGVAVNSARRMPAGAG